MKKQIFTAVLALALALGGAATASADSTGVYHTTDGYVISFKEGPQINQFPSYILKGWHKSAGTRPWIDDAEVNLTRGTICQGLECDGQCDREVYTFSQTQPKTTIEFFHVYPDCPVKPHLKGVIGELIIGNGPGKGHHWFRR